METIAGLSDQFERPCPAADRSQGGPTASPCTAHSGREKLRELIQRLDGGSYPGNASAELTAALNFQQHRCKSDAIRTISPPRKENILAPARNQPSGNNQSGHPPRNHWPLTFEKTARLQVMADSAISGILFLRKCPKETAAS